MKLPGIPPQRDRQITHLAMAALAVMACVLTSFLSPDASLARVATIGLGYLALAQLMFTLLVGPAEILLKTSLNRNPVNIHLRRDVGIWAGINALAHVIFGLQVHRGGDIVQYYFERVHGGLRLLSFADVFGFSNYTGGLAVIFIMLLLLISNNLSMTILRGSIWKWVQRTNYILAALTLAHTFGYQIEVQRPPIMVMIVVGLTLLTIATQLTGVCISIARRSPKTESKSKAENGCMISVVVMVAVPILLAVCLMGLWLYGVSVK